MLPEIQVTRDATSYLTAFAGVNLNMQIADGEFSDMRNMSNDNYPVLTNRDKRGIIQRIEKPQGVLGGRYFSYVDDNVLFYDGMRIKELEKTDQERQLVMMGAYLCVFPDGYIYNTNDKTESTVRNRFDMADYPGYEFKMQMCRLNGNTYDSENTVVSESEPEDKTKYWLDISKPDSVVLKMYATTTSMWTSVGTSYVKITVEKNDGGTITKAPVGKGFEKYDGVKFHGVEIKGYNDYDFNQTNLIYDRGEDYLIIVGFIDILGSQTEPVMMERELPEMDFVCEQNNRLFGCSSKNHEIYACKQGDPKNWYSYAGLVSDSYTATVGSQNDFTGIAAYKGYVVFFKEDGVHQLYGTAPSNFQLQWKAGVGVQDGSSKSVVVVDDTLIFKAKDGFYAYDGAFRRISDAIGVKPFYDAVAGAYRTKYYVCMRDVGYHYMMYVYDTARGSWVIEDEKQYTDFAYTNNGLHMIGADHVLYCVNKEVIYKTIFPQDPTLLEKYSYPGNWYPHYYPKGDLEDSVEWMFESGDLSMNSPGRKYIKRINVRMWLDSDAKMRLEIMYDSSGEWKNLGEYYSTRKRSYELPVAIQRCDHFRLRFSGFGDMRLYSIAQVHSEGSGKDEQ